jgi:hypothetical protein
MEATALLRSRNPGSASPDEGIALIGWSPKSSVLMKELIFATGQGFRRA